MDEVFGALDDPSRRLLLDRLFVEDGQTLTELCAHLPEMTRFGVMNHLRVLEEAGLVTTVKVGRSKHHYLNPVPIRLVHDRWISKYTDAAVGAIVAVKRAAEEGASPMDQPDHVYQAFIAVEPERVWHAIVDGDVTVRYFYGTRVESEWVAGSAVRYMYPDGRVAADGEVIAIDPPHRLEMTFHARWDPDLEKEGPVRQVWRLEAAGTSTKLTAEYYGMPAGTATFDDFSNGIPYIVSAMKTLLETGTELPPPPPYG